MTHFPLLTERQQATLRAAVDRVIPPDDGQPGGVAAGAYDYILGQLGRDLAGSAAGYRLFLDALDAAAAATGKDAGSASQVHFSTLPPAAQDALLARFEKAADWRVFFRQFVEHAQEGFYTSPAGFELIGWKVRG